MRRLAVLAGMVALLAGCGSGGGSSTRTPVVVDTDLSTDDVIALAYLARRPDVELRAVAVSGTGLVHCPGGADLALRVLAVLGKPDMPVACGAQQALEGDDEFPPDFREGADRLFGLLLPAPAAKPASGGGVALLRRAIEDADGRTTVLSLAPLTDTALLLGRHPQVRDRIARVVAMGGALAVPGNIGAGHERVEYNVWADPTAAAAVVASGVPFTLVPLDATNGAPVTIEAANLLQRNHYATPAATLVWDLFANTGMFQGGQYFWDPVAATALTSPALLRFRDLPLKVVTAPGVDHGRTVEAADGARVRVATRLDGRAFQANLLRTLLGRTPAAEPARPVASLVYDGGAVRYEGPAAGQPGMLAVRTVNDGDRSFTFTAGSLLEGRTVADLKRLVRRLHGAFEPPSWFSVEAKGTTPPHSTMTWLWYSDAGTKASVSVVEGRPGGFVVGPVELAAAQ